MKISEVINKLNEILIQNGDMDVSIYVPGDDSGYWSIEKEKQFKVERYADTNEPVLHIQIY